MSVRKIIQYPIIMIFIISCGGSPVSSLRSNSVDDISSLDPGGGKSELCKKFPEYCPGEEPGDGGGKPGDPAPQPKPPVTDKSSLKNCDDWNSYLGVDDPMACNVWHILANNQRVENLRSGSGYMNESAKTSDFNIARTYDTYRGTGVKVHVADTGLDSIHEDIKGNFSLNGSRDYGRSSSSDNPPLETGTSSHGTMVGGLMAAEGNNGIGLMGVAWDASISGDNFLGHQTQASISETYKKNPSVDVWNGSFGRGVSQVVNHQQISDSDVNVRSALVGANDNNILFFKSNGNDGRTIGADGNMESIASLYVINAIAALTTSNEVINYSTPGSNVVLSGYAHKGGSSLGTCTTYKGGDNYTCSMNGTSSASPTVAGAAALVMEALKKSITNPNWTDLLYVLIRSANQNITDRASKYSGSIGSQAKVAKLKTGFIHLEHSFDHGFGVPDIGAAIEFAEVYTEDMRIPYPQDIEATEESEQSISSGSCTEQSISFTKDFQIWSAEVSVKTSGLNKSRMGIFLEAPNGKIMMVKNNGESASSTNMGYSQRFNVRAPLGLNANGEWKVKVCSSSGSGTFTGARVKLYGFNDINTLR